MEIIKENELEGNMEIIKENELEGKRGKPNHFHVFYDSRKRKKINYFKIKEHQPIKIHCQHYSLKMRNH
jgi:hypothetical protein